MYYFQKHNLQSTYTRWISELKKVGLDITSRERKILVCSDISSLFEYMPPNEFLYEAISEDARAYVKKLHSLNWEEQLLEYKGHQFVYTFFPTSGAATFIPEFNIDVADKHSVQTIQSVSTISDFSTIDKLYIHREFEKSVLPKSQMGVFYFDAKGILVDVYIALRKMIESGKHPQITIIGDEGVGKKHLKEIVETFYNPDIDCPDLPVNTESVNNSLDCGFGGWGEDLACFDAYPTTYMYIKTPIINCKVGSKPNDSPYVDMEKSVVYLPSISELLNSCEIYHYDVMPISYAMTIDKVIDRQIAEEMAFWGFSNENFTLNDIRYLFRKKQLWSICVEQTKCLSSFSLEHKRVLDKMGMPVKLVRKSISNNNWNYNYNSIALFFEKAFRKQEWMLPVVNLTEFELALVKEIDSIPYFTDSIVDNKLHRDFKETYACFVQKNQDIKIVIILLQLKARLLNDEQQLKLITDPDMKDAIFTKSQFTKAKERLAKALHIPNIDESSDIKMLRNICDFYSITIK